MLITISLADYKLANHYTDPTADYVSSLKITTVSTKKGIATDTFKFSVEKSVLDHLDETFAYLCYKTPVKVYIDNQLMFDGFVDKLDTSAKNVVNFDCLSIMQWQLQQFVSPSIDALCQNQVYSENCTLVKEDFNYAFTS